MPKQEYLQIRAEAELRDKLKEEADKRGLSISSLIRMIVLEWLAKNRG